jgi:hypothetical protein
LSGSKHLAFLIEEGLLEPKCLEELNIFYSKRLASARKHSSDEKSFNIPVLGTNSTDERLLLDAADGTELGNILNAPELQNEVERAVLQIRQKLDPKPEFVESHRKPYDPTDKQ